jgi:hypothetical protein
MIPDGHCGWFAHGCHFHSALDGRCTFEEIILSSLVIFDTREVRGAAAKVKPREGQSTGYLRRKPKELTIRKE